MARTVRSVGSISVLGRSFVVTDNVDVVFGAPVPQCSLCGFDLECVPFVQKALRCQEFFEARVGAAMPKELLNSVVQPRKFLRRKTQREITSEVKVILVWDCDVAI